MEEQYYRRDLALVHHRGFGFHAEGCADDILALLEPIRGGTVLELGCGSGLLTRRLVDAGHRVFATDASPAMLELANQVVPDAQHVGQLVLPDDPLPPADAIVSVGHVLNYLPNRAAVDHALTAIAGALRPGGVLALDVCDLRWGAARRNAANVGMVGDDWAIVSRFSVPAADRFVREMTTFVQDTDGSWRRDDERHDNVLIETSAIPALLGNHGVTASTRPSFGESSTFPDGLLAVVGTKRPQHRPTG